MIPALAPAAVGLSLGLGTSPGLAAGSAMLTLPLRLKSFDGSAGAPASALRSACASKRTCFTWSCNVTLKSNASLRSTKPMPRNACRAPSTTRITKYRLLSETGSTEISGFSLESGHVAKSEPLVGSSIRTLQCLPVATTRTRPVKMWLDFGQSWQRQPPAEGRGGSEYKWAWRSTVRVRSVSSLSSAIAPANLSRCGGRREEKAMGRVVGGGKRE
mmetsp:Transcript_30392/g.92830  ORF Transcript_30392/g.92830 Transcript_30392/m.92830 type:complete len:216 (-) Transcript_30392:57-704(-)